MTAVSEAFDDLLAEVRSCTACAPHLPLGPRPVLRGRPSARLLIISQAPGARVHDTGLSFDDRSGDRLREWLALDRETFYDETRIAIMPIGLCYPGSDRRGGDGAFLGESKRDFVGKDGRNHQFDYISGGTVFNDAAARSGSSSLGFPSPRRS